MFFLISALGSGLSAVASVFLKRVWERRGYKIPGIFLYLSCVLPFAAGGFHTYTAMLTALLLIANLLLITKKRACLRFVWNLNTAAVLFVTLAYCITPFWAADKGMASFSVVRYLPLFLYVLTLMQYPPEERTRYLELIPLSGAWMILFSCFLLLIPGMDTYLTVNGRLSAFFQYPNTFAAFLLAGIVLLNSKSVPRRIDPLINGLLILGIILSGSQTGFLLLVAALIGIVLIHRKWSILIVLSVPVILGLFVSMIAARTEILTNANRFTTIGSNSTSFLIRLLYYKDALPVILRNPFGLGYLGYRATECTFQTGRYTVSFVHNGFLQMLLDIGWFPSLLMAAAFLRGLLSKYTAPGKKLLLFIVLGHCMLDFDLQFFVFWVILLGSLDFESGKVYVFRKQKTLGVALCALTAIVCLWLGSGDLLCNLGATDLGLAVTPFHTDALSVKLRSSSDAEELDALADQILDLCPTNSLAYSAKANAAFSRGQVFEMMRYKEQAIAFSPYTIEEYCDYIDKLYAVYSLYVSAGDLKSAAYCLDTMLSIPDIMAQVSANIDPLANITESNGALILPQQYQNLLTALAKNSQHN